MPSFVLEVVKIAATVGTARMEKGALVRRSAHMISDMGNMRTKLDEVRLIMNVAEVRDRGAEGASEGSVGCILDQAGCVSQCSQGN